MLIKNEPVWLIFINTQPAKSHQHPYFIALGDQQLITVNSNITHLDQYIDGFDAYLALMPHFTHEKLFLLESLSGPESDTSKSVVGINPILNLTVKNDILSIHGQDKICTEVEQALRQQPTLTPGRQQGQYHLRELAAIWEILRTIEQQFCIEYGQAKTSASLRFGFFGYFGYDVVHAIENIPQQIADDKPVPEINLSIFQGLIISDLTTSHSYAVHNDINSCPKLDTALIIDKLQQTQASKKQHPIGHDQASALVQTVNDSIDQDSYLAWVEQAKYHISIGDIYQIQIGHELTINSDISPFEVYRRLRALNPSPYMYLANFNGVYVIGASPELFISIHNDTVTARPIAGTIKRGASPEEDEQLKLKLAQDEKECAEHIMLVDLARNDISRICQTGSLNADELMVIEKFSHVFHLVSTVTGAKRSNLDKYDVLAANFPAGTVTGTPKVRAMELIEQTENSRRGLYAGCLGFIDFNGTVETALCIRTALYHNDTYTIRASAGIVADSQPIKEWQETLSKLSSTYLAITGQELK